MALHKELIFWDFSDLDLMLNTHVFPFANLSGEGVSEHKEPATRMVAGWEFGEGAISLLHRLASIKTAL